VQEIRAAIPKLTIDGLVFHGVHSHMDGTNVLIESLQSNQTATADHITLNRAVIVFKLVSGELKPFLQKFRTANPAVVSSQPAPPSSEFPKPAAEHEDIVDL
jgi:hypothetical protein